MPPVAPVPKPSVPEATNPAAPATTPATPKPDTAPAVPPRPGALATSPPSKTSSPTSATLSIADVKQLRDRLDTVKPGVPVRGSTPGDQLVAAMAAKLDAARAEDRATIAALEARLTAVTAQVADLKSQAADLAAGAAAASGYHSAELHNALTVTDRLLAELALSKASGQAVTADLAASKASLVRVQREVGDLRAAVDPKATGAAVLGPETVAALLNDFVGSFTSNLTGLGVASGEVSLKTAFAQFGKGAGFVLPTAHTPAGELPLLHEITLRLDTRG